MIAQATTPDIQHVTDAAIAETVLHFTGALEQRPSAVSAVKVDANARTSGAGREEVELPARTVTVEEFTILDIRRDDGADDGVADTAGFPAIDVDVRVRCSAGTYIRSLARDVGQELGVGGHLTELRRTRSGTVDVIECVDLDGADLEHVSAPGVFARQHLPTVDLSDDQVVRVRNGARVGIDVPDASTVALIGPGEDLVAVVDGTASGGQYSITAVFPAIPLGLFADTRVWRGRPRSEGQTNQAHQEHDAQAEAQGLEFARRVVIDHFFCLLGRHALLHEGLLGLLHRHDLHTRCRRVDDFLLQGGIDVRVVRDRGGER